MNTQNGETPRRFCSAMSQGARWRGHPEAYLAAVFVARLRQEKPRRSGARWSGCVRVHSQLTVPRAPPKQGRRGKYVNSNRLISCLALASRNTERGEAATENREG